MSLLDHEAWPDLVPYVRIQTYDRDGGHDHPRHRIEVDRPSSGILVRRFLAMEMPCVACGRSIHPIRQRKGPDVSLFIAVTCGLDVNYGCARGNAARDEYERIVAAVQGWVDPRQPVLW